MDAERRGLAHGCAKTRKGSVNIVIDTRWAGA